MIHFEEIELVSRQKIQSFAHHTFITGKTGSGKSMTGEGLLTNQVGKEKCIDFFDDGRFENFLYGLPENNKKLNAKLRLFTGKEPEGFPCQIIAIAGSNLKHYPRLPKNVKVMSIDEDDLTLDDLFYLLGSTEGSKNLLGMIAYDYGDLSLSELMNVLKGLGGGEIHTGAKFGILRTIKRWRQSGLFSDKCERIDFKKILDDKDVITSFSTFLLDSDDERGLFYGLALKKILELKRRRAVKHRVHVYVREVSNFHGMYASNHMGLCRRNFLRILREGRDIGLDLYCDTQRTQDIPTKFTRQFGKIIMLKTDYEDAKKLSEVTRIPYGILSKIPKLGSGEGVVVTGSGYYYPCFFPPTQHLHKRPGMDVLSLLGKKFGWHDTSSILEISPKNGVRKFVSNESANSDSQSSNGSSNDPEKEPVPNSEVDGAIFG